MRGADVQGVPFWIGGASSLLKCQKLGGGKEHLADRMELCCFRNRTPIYLGVDPTKPPPSTVSALRSLPPDPLMGGPDLHPSSARMGGSLARLSWHRDRMWVGWPGSRFRVGTTGCGVWEDVNAIGLDFGSVERLPFFVRKR